MHCYHALTHSNLIVTPVFFPQVSSKFFSVNDNASKNLNELIAYVNGIKQELAEGMKSDVTMTISMN